MVNPDYPTEQFLPPPYANHHEEEKKTCVEKPLQNSGPSSPAKDLQKHLKKNPLLRKHEWPGSLLIRSTKIPGLLYLVMEMTVIVHQKISQKGPRIN